DRMTATTTDRPLKTELLKLSEAALEKARKLGADSADVLALHATDEEAECRLGKVESLERSEAAGLGLRVFMGKRYAVVSTNELTMEAVNAIAERAVAMARISPEDPY